MSSIIFGPDEKVILSDKGRIEQPFKQGGEIYLTTKRLLLIQKSGLIKKKEIPLVDITIDNISYAKVEGRLSKTLVLGITEKAGRIITYKVKVKDPDAWLAEIYRLKRGES